MMRAVNGAGTFALLCLSFILVAGQASAAIIYTSPTGNDTTGNGSLSNPYRTLAKVASVAEPGDTVCARGGTYCACQPPMKPARERPPLRLPLGWESLFKTASRMGTAAAPRCRSPAAAPNPVLFPWHAPSSVPLSAGVSANGENTTSEAAGVSWQPDEFLDSAGLASCHILPESA